MDDLMVEGFKVKARDAGDGWFVLTIPELPGIKGMAKTREDAVRVIKRLITAYMADFLDEQRELRKKGKDRKEGGIQPPRMKK